MCNDQKLIAYCVLFLSLNFYHAFWDPVQRDLLFKICGLEFLMLPLNHIPFMIYSFIPLS